MRCPRCHAINRPDALRCFRCQRPFHAGSRMHADPPAWLLHDKQDVLRRIHHPPAVFSAWQIWRRRLVATLVDHGIVVLAFTGLLTIAIELTDYPVQAMRTRMGVQMHLALVFLLLHYLYTLIFQVFLGATPGYFWMGLALMPSDRTATDFGLDRITLRWGLMILLTVCGGLTGWWSLLAPDHHFLHDRLARTRVVSQSEYRLYIDLTLKE